jgi:ribosomal protein L37E
MSRVPTEIHCECARCGKSAYNTIQWLKEHATFACERCGTLLVSAEILRVNSNAVRDAAEAERRQPNTD